MLLQIHRPGSKTPQVITGRVFVVKNPAFHPGDIRVLEAVNCLKLHHMIDTLVFPANGLNLGGGESVHLLHRNKTEAGANFSPTRFSYSLVFLILTRSPPTYQ